MLPALSRLITAARGTVEGENSRSRRNLGRRSLDVLNDGDATCGCDAQEDRLEVIVKGQHVATGCLKQASTAGEQFDNSYGARSIH